MFRVHQQVEQDRPAVARLVGHEGAAYLAAFLLVLIVAAAVDLALIGEYRLERFSAVLLAGVLIIAAALGLSYGLAAGGLALAALHFLAQTPLLPRGWLSEDGLLFGLLCAAVVSAGLYADFTRRRESAARTLLAAGGRLSAHVSDTALGQFMRSAGGEGLARSDALENTGRTVVCVLVIGAGWALARVVGGAFGPGAALILMIGAVLVAGGALGASLGLAGGVLAVLASMAFPAPAQAQFATAAPIIAFDLLMFAAFGWGIGRLADRLQHERRAMDSLTSASREFAAGADEAGVRKILLESLVKVTGGGAVELVDEVGGSALTSPGKAGSGAAGAWRERTLSSDGRVVGTARWLPGVRGGRKDGGDDVAVSVIDLGASAIVRARLGVEKAEMEFRARTEHLRTILLDAVSHHFRSPLAGILGSATSILNLPEQHDREARRELLLIIKEQANRLNRYVENFLSVARLESGAIDVNLTEVAIEPLLYDVWETFGEAGGARRFLHAPVGEAAVVADRSLLGQVFGNILENAIKFSGEGSMVDIRCRREGAQMVIEFTDQGCGVAPGAEDRIFERFFRSQATQAPGLGLGLYITRSLVEMLNGTVTARNRTGGESGLVISVSLPATGAA